MGAPLTHGKCSVIILQMGKSAASCLSSQEFVVVRADLLLERSRLLLGHMGWGRGKLASKRAGGVCCGTALL